MLATTNSATGEFSFTETKSPHCLFSSASGQLHPSPPVPCTPLTLSYLGASEEMSSTLPPHLYVQLATSHTTYLTSLCSCPTPTITSPVCAVPSPPYTTTLPVRAGLHCTGFTGLFSQSKPQGAKAAYDQHNDYCKHSDGSANESRARLGTNYRQTSTRQLQNLHKKKISSEQTSQGHAGTSSSQPVPTGSLI